MFTVASLNIYCAVLLITEPDHPPKLGGVSGLDVGASPLFISTVTSSGGTVWPLAVITEPWCEAAEADSDNHILSPESPWGLVKLPLMNF